MTYTITYRYYFKMLSNIKIQIIKKPFIKYLLNEHATITIIHSSNKSIKYNFHRDLVKFVKTHLTMKNKKKLLKKYPELIEIFI